MINSLCAWKEWYMAQIRAQQMFKIHICTAPPHVDIKFFSGDLRSQREEKREKGVAVD